MTCEDDILNNKKLWIKKYEQDLIKIKIFMEFCGLDNLKTNDKYEMYSFKEFYEKCSTMLLDLEIGNYENIPSMESDPNGEVIGMVRCTFLELSKIANCFFEAFESIEKLTIENIKIKFNDSNG